MTTQLSSPLPDTFQRAHRQDSNTATLGLVWEATKKFIRVMNKVPLTTIVFSPKNDVGFRTFQKMVATLLPGAMSIRGLQTLSPEGIPIFRIEEIRDSSNKVLWIRPHDGGGRLEELLFLWERRIYQRHDLSVRKH